MLFQSERVERTLSLRGKRREPWQPGYAVRRDWPDGTHEFVDFGSTVQRAQARIRRDRDYWRRGPIRPSFWSVALLSRRDFDLHVGRTGCRAPDCAGAEVAALARRAGTR